MTGIFLLVSGWIIVLAAVVLLRPGSTRGAFAVAGIAVQGVGLAILFRSHVIAPGGGR